jgi:hypothetical protein
LSPQPSHLHARCDSWPQPRGSRATRRSTRTPRDNKDGVYYHAHFLLRASTAPGCDAFAQSLHHRNDRRTRPFSARPTSGRGPCCYVPSPRPRLDKNGGSLPGPRVLVRQWQCGPRRRPPDGGRKLASFSPQSSHDGLCRFTARTPARAPCVRSLLAQPPHHRSRGFVTLGASGADLSRPETAVFGRDAPVAHTKAP